MGAEIKGRLAFAGLDIVKGIFEKPRFKRIVTEMNQTAQILGLPDAVRVFAQKAYVNVVSHWDDQPLTESVLREKPVIIVANHEHLVEPLILLPELPSRMDLYAVAADFAGNFFGGAVKDLTLPITFNKNRKGSLINRESINNAIKFLSEGKAVVIFPKPTSKTEKWRSGIGHILDSVIGRNDVYLVMAHIQGAREYDILKVLANVTNIRRSPLNYGLRISKPIAVTDLNFTVDGSADNIKGAKKITEQLEHYYEDWINNPVSL